MNELLQKNVEEHKQKPSLAKVGDFIKGCYYLSPICKLTQPERYEITCKLWRELNKEKHKLN